MMLSNQDIRNAIDNGELKIDPYSDECIKSAGLTLHLGHTLLKPRPGKVVDVKELTVPDYEEIVLKDGEFYELAPGEFLLGATYQKISVGGKLGFLIEGRSTLARVGLTIVQTAMLVYPGHTDRAVTLEFANHGPNPIRLYPLMKIARVALFELKSESTELYDETGKYRGQEDVGPPVFKNEFLGKE